MDRIVVGVDDSPGARAALMWAYDEAALRHAPLEVVHAWSLPLAEGWNSEWPADEAWFQGEARKLLDRLIAERMPDGSGLEISRVPLECEGPAFGLLERSKSAALLVVGSRGRGGFKGLLLGSVSTQCVHHAECPVVVVKTNDPPRPPA
jgi:nucleotide-binding universal stress UspA family protein